GGLDVLVGYEVVQHDGDFVLVKYPVEAVLVELIDGDRGGDVVSQDNVQFGLDQLSGGDGIQSGVGRQNFLSHRHCHNFCSPLFPFHVIVSTDQRVGAGGNDVGVGAGAPVHGAVGILQADVGGGGGAGAALLAAVLG